MNRWIIAALLSVLPMTSSAADVFTYPLESKPVVEAKFERFVSRYFHLYGADDSKIVSPMLEVVSVEDKGSYERWYLTYSVEEGERASAYLLKPKTPPRNGYAKYPMVIAPHPTQALGKDVVVGRYADQDDILSPGAGSQSVQDARANNGYGLGLVQKGYVVFAPDRAGYGERTPESAPPELRTSPVASDRVDAYTPWFRRRWPSWNMTTGKAIWDLERALDFLTTDPRFNFIDQSNIGVMGHSLGSWDSAMLAAYEGYHKGRVKAVVVNGGPGLMFEKALFANENGCLDEFLQGTTCSQLLPTDSNKTYLRQTNLLAMLIAPTPLLVIQGFNDPGYSARLPNSSWYEASKSLTDYYLAEYRLENGDINFWRAPFSLYVHSESHSIKHDARSVAYGFLDRYLYGEGN